MKHFEISITVEGDGASVLFVQPSIDDEDDEILVSVDQLPSIIKTLQKIAKEHGEVY